MHLPSAENCQRCGKYSIFHKKKQNSCFSTLVGEEVTELGRVGKRREDNTNPDESLSSDENEEIDEIADERRLRESEMESVSHQAGSIVTFSKGGLPKEEMV